MLLVEPVVDPPKISAYCFFKLFAVSVSTYSEVKSQNIFFSFDLIKFFTLVIIVSSAIVSFSLVCSRCSTRSFIKLICISFSVVIKLFTAFPAICDKSCHEPLRIDDICSFKPKPESPVYSLSIEYVSKSGSAADLEKTTRDTFIN
jgi:hypothetical protein